MKKYWYVCHVEYCPVCGCERKYRERVYEKPDTYWLIQDVYDWCDAF